MSQRIDKSWLVFASVENRDHDRCIDLFRRPDHSFGFEEFRRDAEDGGAWTAVQYYSALSFGTADEACVAASQAAPWFGDMIAAAPHLRRAPPGS